MSVADWLASRLSSLELEPRLHWPEVLSAMRRSAPSTLISLDCSLVAGLFGEALLDTNQLRGSEQG